MPKKSKDEMHRSIHSEAMRNFDNLQTSLRQEREWALEDRRFYSISGAQWEGSLGEQFINKPKFEVNKIHLAVMRIINEYRNNRITVDFVSKDGSQDDKLTDVLNGLFRADERDSGAEEAYDNAFEEAVGGGYGALRLTTEYEDEEDDENDKQRIRIEPIYDADTSVWFDLDSKRQDKADAKYCFVVVSMSPESYEAEWGESPTSVNKQIDDIEYDWYTPDVVYVAEYYRIESVVETIRIFQTIDGEKERYTKEDFEDDPKLEDTLIAIGSTELSNKRVRKNKVHKYILSGNKVLEDCGYIAGKNIPVVPAFGKRWFIDNIERCMGHVRLAKDMQRLKNMQTSALAEISALSSQSKPIFIPEQMAGFETLWADDNIDNNPYLLVHPITDKDGNPSPAGPIAYTKPPEIPQPLAALLQLTDNDMKEILGNQGEADKMVSNISGKAVELIQGRIDGQAFIYMSNFAKTIRRVGEIWLSMAKDVYVDPGRKMKTIGKMENIGTVELMQPTIGANGEQTLKNDLTKVSFDVAVDVGPSSTSKREATVRALTGMMQITNDPETSKVLQAMAMMNMEGEGISDAKEYFRKQLVGMGVLEPTEEEAQAMAASSEPNANDKALLAMAEEAEAKASKARIDGLKSMSEIEKNKAQTEEIYADIESQKIEDVVKLTTELETTTVQ